MTDLVLDKEEALGRGLVVTHGLVVLTHWVHWFQRVFHGSSPKGKREGSQATKYSHYMDLRSCSQLLKTSKPSLGLRFYYKQSLLVGAVVAWGERGRENWVRQIGWRGGMIEIKAGFQLLRTLGWARKRWKENEGRGKTLILPFPHPHV